MNNQGSPSFLTKNNNKKEEESDDDYMDIKLLKKRRNRLEKFQKFKPKNIINLKPEPSLKGAENKVKSMLSSFLLTMESEDDKNSKRIKFLREKLSSKKAKYNGERRSKQNLNNTKPINSLFINGVNYDSGKNNTSDALISDEKRTNKENFSSRKKLNYNENGKIKISNLNLNKSFVDSKSKSELSDSNDVPQNYNYKARNSDNLKLSIFENEEKINNYFELKKKIYNNNNNANNLNEKKIDKSKLYLKNSFKNLFNLEDSYNSKNSGKNYESSSKNRSSVFSNKEETRRSVVLPKKKKCKDSLINSMYSSNVNKKKVFKQISLNKDKLNILKKFGDKYNITNSEINNEGQRKSLHKVKPKLQQVESVLKNLQEKIKFSIILRPEELKFDENLIPVKRKSKVDRNNLKSENRLSQPEINNVHYSQKNVRNSKDLESINKINNSQGTEIKSNNFLNEKFMSNNKKQILDNKKFLFDVNKQKNDSEISGLKSKINEDISANLLPNMESSKKNMRIYREKYRVMIHKKIIYDSLDDEENEDDYNDYLYIHPESYFILLFDAIVLFSAIYSLIYYPYYLAHSLTFCQESFFSFHRIFNTFIEFVYILDFIFGFFRAYYNFEEQLIRKHSSIINRYLTRWFIFDLISAFPVYSILKFKEKKCDDVLKAQHYNHILNNINYLLLFNRMLKVIKSLYSNQCYNFVSNKINDFKYYNQISLIFQILFILSIFHFTSCVYIFIGRNSYPNWIYSTNLEVKNFSDIYICGIYILITALTTVGYGDITCYSFNERIFQLILLIVGIMAYSYIISFFSNYVKKINEESIDFENRKTILDEIKMTNPNLTNILYDKILRYLKYKKFHENKDKSIIFDCLPSSLKNNLIAEMYRPIIKNFIFFKSFQNIDFIVRVVLSFRPILALKNDVLVNEGDFVEDIMFVKKGVLAVELPLNVVNPEENIYKYLNNPILQIKRRKSFDLAASTIISQGGKAFKSAINSTIKNTTFNNDLIAKTESKNKSKQISFVKILNIRENEHFGDVLMFLEQRSPLRVRVRSKKSELFFLKKIDAIKISSSYQNIWSRINKKSVFNFKQIKKSIIKIIELYCSFKSIQTEEKKKRKSNTKSNRRRRKSMLLLKMNNSFQLEKDEIIARNKSQKDFRVNNQFSEYFHEDGFGLNFTRIQSTRTFSTYNTLTRGGTDNTESLLNIFDSENSGIKNKNLVRNRSLFGAKKQNDEEKNNENNGDDKSKNISGFKKSQINNKNKYDNQALMNAYKGNYKFYEMNNLTNAKTIISEDPGNEESLGRHSSINKGGRKSTFLSININNNQRLSKISSIINVSNNQIEENDKEDLEEDKEDSQNQKSKNPSKKSNTYLSSDQIKSDNHNDSIDGLEAFRNKYILNQVKSDEKIDEDEKKQNLIKSHSSSSYEGYDIKKILSNNQLDDNSNDESNNTPFKAYEINEEIYPGEDLSIPNKGDNLLSKKISLSEVDKKENYICNKDNLKDNSKVRMLLNSNRELKVYINNNNDSIENYQKSNLTDVIPQNNCRNILFKMNKSINNKNLSIISNIQIELLSLYENINKLSNYKFYKNESLQLKIKNILKEQQDNDDIESKHSLSSCISESIKGNLNLTLNRNLENNKSTDNIIKIHSSKHNKTISHVKTGLSRKREKSVESSHFQNKSFHNNFHYNNSFHGMKKVKFDLKRKSVFVKTGQMFNDMIESEGLKKRKQSNNKINKSNNNIMNISMSNIRRKYTQAMITSKNTIRDKNKIKMNKTLYISNDKKRKNTSLLSKINSNIEKVNQNLNNPDQFYSNYFQSLIEGEKKNMGENEKKKFSIVADSIISTPKINKFNRVKTKLVKRQSLLNKI